LNLKWNLSVASRILGPRNVHRMQLQRSGIGCNPSDEYQLPVSIHQLDDHSNNSQLILQPDYSQFQVLSYGYSSLSVAYSALPVIAKTFSAKSKRAR